MSYKPQSASINHCVCITFMGLSEALKGGFIMTCIYVYILYIYIYIYMYMYMLCHATSAISVL